MADDHDIQLAQPDPVENVSEEPLEDTILEFDNMLNTKAQAASESMEKVAEESGAVTPLPGYEKVVAQLQAALDQGEVPPRSALGQKFMAHLERDEADKKLYESLKGVPEATKKKADFRKKWAENELRAKTVVRRSKLEQVSAEMAEEGKYMTFERLVMMEGGASSKKAVEVSMNYAMECVKRGPPYIQWHSWKKTTELLVFEQVKRNIHKTVHQLERTAIVHWSPQQSQRRNRPTSALCIHIITLIHIHMHKHMPIYIATASARRSRLHHTIGIYTYIYK